MNSSENNSDLPFKTPIQQCVDSELRAYFELLDGEQPRDLYRLVTNQADRALIKFVLEICNGNQSKAAIYLGVSRGTLRTKLSNMKESVSTSFS